MNKWTLNQLVDLIELKEDFIFLQINKDVFVKFLSKMATSNSIDDNISIKIQQTPKHRPPWVNKGKSS